MSKLLAKLQTSRYLSIQWKLVLPFVLITIIVLLFLLPISTRRIEQNIEADADRRLSQTADSITALIEDAQQQVVLSANFVANLPEMAFVINDSDLLANILPTRKEELRLQELSYYKSDYEPGDPVFYYGGPIISRRLQISENITSVRDNLVQEALDSGKPASGVAISPQSSQVIGVAPVTNSNNELDGVIMAVIFLDNTFAQNIAQILDTDLAIVTDNAVIVSTIDEASEYVQLINNGFIDDTGLITTENINYGDGTPYRLMSHPLTLNDMPQGNVLIAEPISELFQLRQASFLILAIFAGVVTLASLIIGSAAARSFSIPVKKLTVATSKVSEGDLEQRVETSYFMFKDEVTTLSENFNGMTADLQELYNTLEERIKLRTQQLEEERNKLDKALKELAVAHDEAVAANQAKSEFVSLVSHELKVPMTSIKGYADLMTMGASGPISDKQKQFLSTIQFNVERMKTLVSDLTDISRIESGQLTVEPQEESISVLINRVLESLQNQIKERTQILKIDVPEDLPDVWCDHNRTMQVMTNLISNAYKYTPDGGEIRIQAKAVTENGNPNHKVVQVAVADTGYGISEEQQKGIFQKFFRADDEQARQSPGTGLGLSITKNLVELQNGRIWFESEFRQGTTFFFTIPLAENSQK